MSDLLHLSPTEAHQFLQNTPNSVLIDVRSSMEYLFVGHPIGSIHIPWIDEPDWEPDPNFAKITTNMISGKLKNIDVKTEAHIVLICRSGKRTLDAAAALEADGYEHILHITEGFEGERDDNNHRSTVGGWRYHGLPWEQC